MSRWFRHYVGMMRDAKLVSVAVRSGQPIHLVTWVWGALLESASEINDGGRYNLDPDEVGYFLRCETAQVATVLAELESSGRIHEGVVTRWGDRQFDNDTSKDRQRRYREKRRGAGEVTSPASHGDVTPASRDGEVTLQEYRDREQIEEESSLRSPKNGSANPPEPTVREELGVVLDPERANSVIEHRKKLRKPLTPRAAHLLAGKFAKAADANAAADAMVANGWQGFEPEWLENRKGTGPPRAERRDQYGQVIS